MAEKENDEVLPFEEAIEQLILESHVNEIPTLGRLIRRTRIRTNHAAIANAMLEMHWTQVYAQAGETIQHLLREKKLAEEKAAAEAGVCLVRGDIVDDDDSATLPDQREAIEAQWGENARVD